MLKAYARSNFNEKWHFIAASSEKKLEIVNNEHNLLFFFFFLNKSGSYIFQPLIKEGLLQRAQAPCSRSAYSSKLLNTLSLGYYWHMLFLHNSPQLILSTTASLQTRQFFYIRSLHCLG
jgi:hypothetical protein